MHLIAKTAGLFAAKKTGLFLLSSVMEMVENRTTITSTTVDLPSGRKITLVIAASLGDHKYTLTKGEGTYEDEQADS